MHALIISNDYYQHALIISNEEMICIIEIIKSLEENTLLIKFVSQTIKKEVKEQRGGLFGVILGTLRARLLGNLLLGKGVIRVGEGTIRVVS